MVHGLVFRGLGTVGLALFDLMSEASGRIAKDTGMSLVPVALADSRGHAFTDGTWDNAVSAVRSKRETGSLAGGPLPLDSLGALGRDMHLDGIVVLDATPSDYANPDPGTSALESILAAGFHVVTACKSPLATAWDRIEGARVHGRSGLGFTAATGLTFPGVGHIKRAMAGSVPRGIEAVANGTTAYILGAMETDGIPFETALSRAQAQGIAEPDPSLDVDGWDTAAKLSILRSCLTGEASDVRSADRCGIRGVTPGDMEEARKARASVKLVGVAGPSGVSVAPRALESGHPLRDLKGTEKGFVFDTDLHGAVCIRGGRSGIRTTAAVMLSDLMDVILFGN